MADLIDVENALVALAAAAVYPNGTSQASAIAGAVPCKVYAGWPTESQLDADLAAGTVHATVYPLQVERNTTRFLADWQQQAVNTPTLTLAANGQQITLAGTIPPTNNPHVLSVLVNGLPYVYQVLATDTISSAAAALAALIAAGVPGTTSAAGVITVAAGGRIGALQVGVTGTSIREVRRQERSFQITLWAHTPAARDSMAALIDGALAPLRFITLADGTAARLIYRQSYISDMLQKARLYRRDLVYSVEYATTQVETDTQITQTQLNESVQISGATAYVAPQTSYQ